ncbi:o-succinylbenzoate--CoA ligase [Saccharothrix sp. AJ9571]|nr:o-succinylbenzoate--CoA ligase [Saccharothrix sp. AJ9571]
MRVVTSVPELTGALAAALDGGPAVLPLAAGNTTLRDAMRPDLPVEDGTAVIIATSGSTGAPKGVLLSADALRSSAGATHERLGGPGRWLLATPPQFIGGLQVLVRSMLAGTTPVVLDTSAGFRAEDFAAGVRELVRQPGPHYSALVPTQLSRLVAAGPEVTREVARLDAIVLGGAALDPRLAERAADAGITAVPAYGMSETASGCVYAGIPLSEVDIRIGTGGRVEIAGPVLAHGYRLNPELTAESFVDGWFRTSDLGRLDGGRLEVLGRADDVINTGGVKVPAAAVERALLTHPAVRAVCVVGVPDPEWGEAVVAAVVLAEATLPEDDLRALVRADSGAAAVPKRFLTLEELPLRGPGKVDRSGVRAHFKHG